MFCFIFYALFLCCNALIHLGCILGWHVKKECVWAPVPWKAEPEGKLAYWRFAGRGIPGHQEWEKENEEVKRGKRKENHQDSTSFRGKHSHIPDAGCQQRQRLAQLIYESSVAGGREEKGTDPSVLHLLSFDGQGLCFRVASCKHPRRLLGSLGSMDSAKSSVAARTSVVLCRRKSKRLEGQQLRGGGLATQRALTTGLAEAVDPSQLT